MKPFPAIALLEIENIALGLKTADAMLKQSPIALLKTGTISRGKYLILVAGSVASVDEAYQKGMQIAAGSCIDNLYLPDVHPRVYTAMLGKEVSVQSVSLGTLETPSIATTIAAADKAIKGAAVDILEMRLGDNYGGKGYVLFNGEIEDVQQAIDIVTETAGQRNCPAATSIIPMLHEALAEQLNGSLRFQNSKNLELPDGEKDVTG